MRRRQRRHKPWKEAKRLHAVGCRLDGRVSHHFGIGEATKVASSSWEKHCRTEFSTRPMTYERSWRSSVARRIASSPCPSRGARRESAATERLAHEQTCRESIPRAAASVAISFRPSTGARKDVQVASTNWPITLVSCACTGAAEMVSVSNAALADVEFQGLRVMHSLYLLRAELRRL